MKNIVYVIIYLLFCSCGKTPEYAIPTDNFHNVDTAFLDVSCNGVANLHKEKIRKLFLYVTLNDKQRCHHRLYVDRNSLVVLNGKDTIPYSKTKVRAYSKGSYSVSCGLGGFVTHGIDLSLPGTMCVKIKSAINVGDTIKLMYSKEVPFCVEMRVSPFPDN